MRILIVCLFWIGFGAGCHKDVSPDCIARENTCLCSYELNEVCGCDGKTYANPCMAQCAGVKYTKGTCKP
ncbi:Kazal-type serine protease inhibitor family protein [Spirosoma daeguense]